MKTYAEGLEEGIKIGKAAEKEACAVLADELDGTEGAGFAIAAAIRARPEDG